MLDTLAEWCAEVEKAANAAYDAVPDYMRDADLLCDAARGTTRLLFVGP